MRRNNNLPVGIGANIRDVVASPPLENWSLPTLDTGGGISHFHSNRGNEVAKDDCKRSPPFEKGGKPLRSSFRYNVNRLDYLGT
jgi:hypothetical protein